MIGDYDSGTLTFNHGRSVNQRYSIFDEGVGDISKAKWVYVPKLNRVYFIDKEGIYYRQIGKEKWICACS